MKQPLLALFACLLTAAPAWASANVSCAIDDKVISFDMEAIAGRAGPITQVQVGSIAIKPAAKVNLASPQISFDQSHIVQQWSLGGDLRLQIEIDNTAAKQNVNLLILARLDRKTEKYSGRYVLKITRDGDSKDFNGRIKECQAG